MQTEGPSTNVFVKTPPCVPLSLYSRANICSANSCSSSSSCEFNSTPLPLTSFVFSWRRRVRWRLLPFWWVTQSSWSRPHIYMLLNFCFSPVNQSPVSLILGPARGASKGEEKFFLPDKFPLRRVRQTQPGPYLSGQHHKQPSTSCHMLNLAIAKYKSRKHLGCLPDDVAMLRGEKKVVENCKKKKKKRHYAFFWITERKALTWRLAQHHGNPNTFLFLLVSICQPWVSSDQPVQQSDSQPTISWFLSSSWFSSVPEDKQELCV